jgi:GT2 family glycosyltransferase
VTAPDAAILIVNYRTPELVSRCLAAVERSTGELRFEVAIVDNGSGDGSVDALRDRHREARIVAREHNDGFAAGVNAGFAATAAPIVVLLNPDTKPHPRSLDLLVRHLRTNSDVGVAVPQIMDVDGAPQPNAYRRFPNLITVFVDFCIPVGHTLAHVPRLHPHVLPPSRVRVGARVAHATGAALAVQREAYEEAGPFDEGYFLYLEETDWLERVQHRGWAVELVPEARVVHRVRGGGAAAHVPSLHYLPSAYRYLGERGTSETAIDATLLLSTLLSRLTLLAAAALRPSRRPQLLKMARGYAGLASYVAQRRRARGGS